MMKRKTKAPTKRAKPQLPLSNSSVSWNLVGIDGEGETLFDIGLSDATARTLNRAVGSGRYGSTNGHVVAMAFYEMCRKMERELDAMGVPG